MAYTKADLRTLTLKHLRIVGTGQSATAEDGATVDERLTLLHARLEGLGLNQKAGVAWTLDTVPDYAAFAYARMAAADCFGSFAIQLLDGNSAEQERLLGERELRRQIMTAYDPAAAQEATYY